MKDHVTPQERLQFCQRRIYTSGDTLANILAALILAACVLLPLYYYFTQP